MFETATKNTIAGIIALAFAIMYSIYNLWAINTNACEKAFQALCYKEAACQLGTYQNCIDVIDQESFCSVKTTSDYQYLACADALTKMNCTDTLPVECLSAQ